MKVLAPVKRVVDFNVKLRVKRDGTGVDPGIGGRIVALAAHGLLLLSLLTAGLIAQAAALGDALVMASAVGGLLCSLAPARLLARHLARRGDMAPPTKGGSCAAGCL